MAASSGSHSYMPVPHNVGKIRYQITSKGKVLKCFPEFKALKLRKIDDVSHTGTVLGMNDEKSIVKWMIGDKERILAHGCRQIKNICVAMNPNQHLPAKKQRAGEGTASDVSSDEEWDDDSGNLVDMFDDVSSVENGDIEDNLGCNGEDNSLP